MNGLKWFCIVFTAGILTSCTSFSVTSDYDLTADFDKLKTFKYLQAGKMDANYEVPSETFVKKRASTAIKYVLASKGYENVKAGEPDFLVVVYAGVKERINVADWGYSYGGWYSPAGYSGKNIDVNYFNEATLFIDIVDNDTDELIWRGAGTGIIQPQSTPEQRAARILDVVEKILEKFPPGK